MSQPKPNFTLHIMISLFMIVLLLGNIFLLSTPTWMTYVLGVAVIMNLVVLVLIKKITSQQK